MLTGYLPFDDNTISRLLAKIKAGRYVPIPAWLSPEAQDLIKSMLVVDPSKRITVSERNTTALFVCIRLSDIIACCYLVGRGPCTSMVNQQDISRDRPKVSRRTASRCSKGDDVR